MGDDVSLTGAIVRSLGSVHDRLVNGLDSESTCEVGIEVREGSHDGGPNESTVVVRLGLLRQGSIFIGSTAVRKRLTKNWGVDVQRPVNCWLTAWAPGAAW